MRALEGKAPPPFSRFTRLANAFSRKLANHCPRLATVKARRRLHETLSGRSLEAYIRALEEVPDHVNRLVTEAHPVRDRGDPALEKPLGTIRDAEAERAARAQLDEPKSFSNQAAVERDGGPEGSRGCRGQPREDLVAGVSCVGKGSGANFGRR